MQAWRMRALLVAIIVLLPFEVVLLVALWPYLPIVGKAIAGLLVTCCVCGAVYVVTITWQRIRAPRVIVAEGVVVMLARDGSYHHLSAQHEAAKLLPAPVIVTEERRDDENVERSKILNLRAKGRSLREIERELDIPYNRVQKICSAAVNLVIEK